MNSQLLTFDEARKYLRVNRGTLYKLIRNGDLPAFRVGKQWRIDKEEFTEWLRKQQVKKKEMVEVEVNA